MAGVTQRAHFLSGPFFVAISNSMRFKVQTLIDVTQTNARRGEDRYEIMQQQNFLTMIQTLGLRVNPIFEQAPAIQTVSVDKLGFGKKYKGKHKVWTFYFEIDYADGLDESMLIDDFHIVPVIGDLDETINDKDNRAFISKNKQSTNIIFKKVINNTVA